MGYLVSLSFDKDMAISGNFERARINYKHAKILIIEDNDDHWTLIKSALQQSLPEVTAVRANGPREALALLTDWVTQEWELPKLILQDLYLPNRADGWDLLKQIKALPASCNRIPLVMFSSSTEQSDIEDAYQYGVSSYLVKPIAFTDWVDYFNELRNYWWDTVTLPPIQFSV
ncbi:response regulator [Spirosoma koreense]